MCGLNRCRRVQDGHEWMHIGDSSAGEGESLWIVHPRIRRHHEEGRCDTRDRDGDAAREMHPRCQTVPRIKIDAKEYRFDEECKTLEREGQADHRAEGAHQPRPQQPHLERQDGPRHRSDGEEDAGYLRPPARESHRIHVTVKSARLRKEDESGKADSQARKDDVPA